MTKRMLLILTLVVTLGTSAAGQSTDENRPTPVTSNVLTGTAQGSGTYVYSLKSRRGTTVNVRADLTLAGDGSQGFSLDFRGKAGVSGGQTTCCEGETYMPLSAEPTFKTSFRVITDESFLMFLNFSAAQTSLPYRITFEGLNFDAEPAGAPGGRGTRDAKVYAGRDMALERGALAQRTRIHGMLSPSIKRKLDGVLKAFLARSLRDKKPIDLSMIVKEEVGRQFVGLSPRQSNILTFYVLTGVIKLIPPHSEERDATSEAESLNGLTQSDMLKLQQMMMRKSQLETMISNGMRAGFEGAQAELRALKDS